MLPGGEERRVGVCFIGKQFANSAGSHQAERLWVVYWTQEGTPDRVLSRPEQRGHKYVHVMTEVY